MLVGVVDEAQRVHYESRERTAGLEVEQLLDALEEEIGAARTARPGVLAAGLGIPCTIDRSRGVAVTAIHLPIRDLPIRDLMEERVGLPMFIDNDANCAALAEYLYGAARGATNAVMLTVGTGIGGGLILNGELYRGSTGAAAELGHLVVDLDGPPCQGNCPNRGCVEVFASGTAIAREGRVAGEREPDSALGRALAAGTFDGGRTVTEAAVAGDRAALGVVARAGQYLGMALASYANVFDPDVIVVGGGVASAGDTFLDPAREIVAERAEPPMNQTPVRAAELGSDAGMIGAAAMALAELDAGR